MVGKLLTFTVAVLLVMGCVAAVAWIKVGGPWQPKVNRDLPEPPPQVVVRQVPAPPVSTVPPPPPQEVRPPDSPIRVEAGRNETPKQPTPKPPDTELKPKVLPVARGRPRKDPANVIPFNAHNQFSRWVDTFDSDYASIQTNPIAYRAFLRKMRDKARLFAHDFKGKSKLIIHLQIKKIEEDCVYLEVARPNKWVQVYPQGDQRPRAVLPYVATPRLPGPLLIPLKIGRDIDKEVAEYLRPGKLELFVTGEVVDITVETAIRDNARPYLKVTVKDLVHWKIRPRINNLPLSL